MLPPPQKKRPAKQKMQDTLETKKDDKGKDQWDFISPETDKLKAQELAKEGLGLTPEISTG